MVNKLQVSRDPETKMKIQNSLRKKYQEQGGMKEETKRKISEKMKRNWLLKKKEEENNKLNGEQINEEKEP